MWELLQKPLVVDDGAIFFHKYKNFPGTFTKFVYKGLGDEGIEKLMDDGDEFSEVVIAVRNKNIFRRGFMIELPKKILYYVTGQPAKAALFARYFPQGSGIIVEHVSLDLFEEQVEDQEKIAIAKARQAWGLIKKPLIVDDGAIFFHKYKNFPGTFTKFVYKGLGDEGIEKLMDDGDEFSEVVIAVLIYGPDQYKVFKVAQTGTFRRVREKVEDSFLRGSHATFVPQGQNKSLAELKQQDPELYERYCSRVLMAKEVARFISETQVL